MNLINCPNFDKQNVPIAQSAEHTCGAMYIFVCVTNNERRRFHYTHGAMTYFVTAPRAMMFGVCNDTLMWLCCDRALYDGPRVSQEKNTHRAFCCVLKSVWGLR